MRLWIVRNNILSIAKLHCSRGITLVSHACRIDMQLTACSHAQLPDIKSVYRRFLALLNIRLGA